MSCTDKQFLSLTTSSGSKIRIMFKGINSVAEKKPAPGDSIKGGTFIDCVSFDKVYVIEKYKDVCRMMDDIVNKCNADRFVIVKGFVNNKDLQRDFSIKVKNIFLVNEYSTDKNVTVIQFKNSTVSIKSTMSVAEITKIINGECVSEEDKTTINSRLTRKIDK